MTTETMPQLDEAKVEEFAGRLFGTFTSASVTLARPGPGETCGVFQGQRVYTPVAGS